MALCMALSLAVDVCEWLAELHLQLILFLHGGIVSRFKINIERFKIVL